MPRLFSTQTNGYYFIAPPTDVKEAARTLSLDVDFDRDRVLSSAAHEAMPGHLMQIAMSHRNPDFVRRATNSEVFQEGWAYYGEEMFVRLGLYGNDLDPRWEVAGWEKIRGCRAIVDVELASGQWNYRHAVNFFRQNTGVTQAAAQGEVGSIARNPNYVISYTVGRYQLEELLTAYRRRMGARARVCSTSTTGCSASARCRLPSSHQNCWRRCRAKTARFGLARCTARAILGA